MPGRGKRILFEKIFALLVSIACSSGQTLWSLFLFVLFRVMRVDLLLGLRRRRSTNQHETTQRTPQSVPAIKESADNVMKLERTKESTHLSFSRPLFPLPDPTGHFSGQPVPQLTRQHN